MALNHIRTATTLTYTDGYLSVIAQYNAPIKVMGNGDARDLVLLAGAVYEAATLVLLADNHDTLHHDLLDWAEPLVGY